MYEETHQRTGKEAVLLTKLYRPRLHGRLITRQRLIEDLNSGLERPLTLVSAPAGYGKTTLVYQWLESVDRPSAWLSLDEHDNNLGMFVTYVLAALRTIEPEIGTELQQLLSTLDLAAPARLADSLLHDLEQLQRQIVLAIDDYHLVQDTDAHAFLDRIVEWLPPTVRIVLISRVDPPLPLARLRSHGLLRELRATDLRFDYHDTAALLTEIFDDPVEPEIVAAFEERTEGWPAGLRLAAISYQESPDPLGFIRRFANGSNQRVMDYVVEEVWERLPEYQRHLMLRMALLDRFCPALIAAMTDPPTALEVGQELLHRMWQANLFLVALDDGGTWYRYHHLFRDLLRQQLNRLYAPEKISQLLARASRWSEEAGYVEEALAYALQGGDGVRAAEIVENHLHEALNAEDWPRLQRWLAELPAQAHQRSGILAAQIAVDQIRYSASALAGLLAAMRRQLETEKTGYTSAQHEEWEGIMHAYYASVMMLDVTPDQVLDHAETAQRQLPRHASYVRSLAELWQIYATQMKGEPEAAVQLAQARLRDRADQSPVRINRLLLALNAVHYAEADIARVTDAALLYRQYAQRSKQVISGGWSAFLLGWSRYQVDDLQAAEQLFCEVREVIHVVHVRAAIDGLTGLALVYHAQRRPDATREVLAELREFLLQRQAVGMLPMVGTLVWRLGLEDENTFLSTQDLSAAAIRTELAADLWEVCVLTKARADIESGVPQRLAAAAAALRECRLFAEGRNSKRLLLRIGALQASLLLVQGDSEQALVQLRQTVSLGEQSGILREILDSAPDLYPLIQALYVRGVARDYLARMLAVCKPAAQLLLPDRTGPNAESDITAGLLTFREVEILLLVEQRLSNQQIAQKLYLSPHTVKKHTVNIYRKLRVRNRREAVARARAMQLLPTD